MIEYDNFDDITINSSSFVSLLKGGVINLLKRKSNFRMTDYMILAYSKRNNALILKETNVRSYFDCYKIYIRNSRICAPGFFKDNNIVYTPGKYEAIYKRVTRLGMCWVVYLDRKVNND